MKSCPKGPKKALGNEGQGISVFLYPYLRCGYKKRLKIDIDIKERKNILVVRYDNDRFFVIFKDLDYTNNLRF